MPHRFHIRWTIVGLFVVAMVINYLGLQLSAPSRCSIDIVRSIRL